MFVALFLELWVSSWGSEASGSCIPFLEEGCVDLGDRLSCLFLPHAGVMAAMFDLRTASVTLDPASSISNNSLGVCLFTSRTVPVESLGLVIVEEFISSSDCLWYSTVCVDFSELVN